MINYTYKGVITRWIDGDTVDIQVDLGFTIWSKQRFRLDGLDTPERGEPLYKKSIEYVNNLAPSGSEVIVISYKTEKYGRYLGSILTSSNVNINQSLLNEGLAKPYHGEKKS